MTTGTLIGIPAGDLGTNIHGNSVTITHLPTGLTASATSGATMFRNRKIALRMLEAGLILHNSMIAGPEPGRRERLTSVRIRKEEMSQWEKKQP